MGQFSKKIGSFAVDTACALSLVGLWPRFIEPKCLVTTYLDLSIEKLPSLKILHISDLHFHKGTSRRFLDKIIKRVKKEKCDLILFTGDFLCYSRLEKPALLKSFLQQLQAPLGCFCTFGNHDYASYVSRNRQGNYTILKPVNPLTGFFRGLKNFFESTQKGEITNEAKSVAMHDTLCTLLKETPFQLLENTTLTLPIGLNLVGLGDYALGRCLPEIAFASYKKEFPGIVLSHNPDTTSLLLNHPGDLILCGHSHGEQIHFPYPPFLRKLSQKLTRLENPNHSRGHYRIGDKNLYVNRGLGCHKPLRLFSPPELLVLNINRRA